MAISRLYGWSIRKRRCRGQGARLHRRGQCLRSRFLAGHPEFLYFLIGGPDHSSTTSNGRCRDRTSRHLFRKQMPCRSRISDARVFCDSVVDQALFGAHADNIRPGGGTQILRDDARVATAAHRKLVMTAAMSSL